MGKALVVGGVVVFLALIALGAWVYYRATTRVGDLTRKEESELRWLTRVQGGLLVEAATVMVDLGPRMTIDESDVLSERSSRSVEEWLRSYTSLRERVTEKGSISA